jgi:DNA repair protein RadA/Sms
LLLQAAARFAGTVGPVLYSSGEESEHQIKLRGERLGIDGAPLYLLSETCLERILDEATRLRPSLLIVDSIQTVFSLKLQSAPGSIGQVREAATQLLFAAKAQGVPTFLVGHVTKEGSLAGPKALEHIVDTVLYFEGEHHHAHRIVRAVKNRFGAVSEIGVFEMTSGGLQPVPNPSKLFLAERPDTSPGSAVVCCIEGSRPILIEVQALVSTSTYGTARRMAIGIDPNRLSLLLAVLEKRAGLNLAGEDVFVNVAGGVTVDEPAADLGVVAAIAQRPHPSGRVSPGGLRRGRPGRGGPRDHAGRQARARGRADGVLPLHPAEGQHRLARVDGGRLRTGRRGEPRRSAGRAVHVSVEVGGGPPARVARS